MKCTIPSLNLKAFGKAIQSLAKIGDEISIEPTLDGLHLKAVNSTRSCMAFFDFKPRFFQHYDDGSPRPVDQNSTPRFRLASKCCLNVFRSLNSIDKLVQHCQISLNESQSRVVFSLFCKHDIVKTYNLTFMEADPLNCSLSKGACANQVKAEAKLFSEILASFPNNLEELTMIVNERNMCVRNYVDAELADPLKSFSTTMTLARDEFEFFDVGVEASVSFCLKEVRAALAFAEYMSYNVSLHFDEAGRPMFININCDPAMEMTFIVSTISETSSQSSCASSTSSVSRATAGPSSKPSSVAVNRPIGKLHTQGRSVSTRATERRPSASSMKPQAAGNNNSKHSTSSAIHDPSNSTVKVEARLDSLINNTSITLLQTRNEESSSQQQPKVNVDQLLKEIDDDSLSVTPSAKKAKTMFFKKKPASKPQTNTQKYLDEILADDSDD